MPKNAVGCERALRPGKIVDFCWENAEKDRGRAVAEYDDCAYPHTRGSLPRARSSRDPFKPVGEQFRESGLKVIFALRGPPLEKSPPRVISVSLFLFE
jgi:hypothetical protein